MNIKQAIDCYALWKKKVAPEVNKYVCLADEAVEKLRASFCHA